MKRVDSLYVTANTITRYHKYDENKDIEVIEIYDDWDNHTVDTSICEHDKNVFFIKGVEGRQYRVKWVQEIIEEGSINVCIRTGNSGSWVINNMKYKLMPRNREHYFTILVKDGKWDYVIQQVKDYCRLLDMEYYRNDELISEKTFFEEAGLIFIANDWYRVN